MNCREKILPSQSKNSPAKEFLTTFKESFKSPTHKTRNSEVNSEVPIHLIGYKMHCGSTVEWCFKNVHVHAHKYNFFELCRLSLTQAFGFQEQRVKPMGDDLLTEKGPNRYHDPQVTQQSSSSLHMYMCTYLIVQLYLYVVFGIIRYSKFSFLYCISAISIIYHINVWEWIHEIWNFRMWF